MGRPRVYISSPISNGGTLAIWEQKTHVHYATQVAFDLIRKGFSVYTPHWSLLGEELISDRLPHGDWIANDLPWINACDALLRLPGESKGADREVEHAIEHGILVYREVAGLHRHFHALGRVP